jgi:hypothetical protein
VDQCSCSGRITRFSISPRARSRRYEAAARTEDIHMIMTREARRPTASFAPFQIDLRSAQTTQQYYMRNALERANKVSVAPAVTRHKMNRDSLGNFPLGVIISLRLMFGVVFFVIYLAAPSRISARTSKMTRRKMSIFSSQGLGFAWRQLAHYFLSSFK